jgi:hypothetical protein
MRDFWEKYWPYISSLVGLLIVVIGGYTASIIWAKERLDNIEKIPTIEKNLEEVAGAVQQLQQSNLFQIWINLDRKRKAVGLTPQEHAQWCSIGKQIGTLSTCPNWVAGPQR